MLGEESFPEDDCGGCRRPPRGGGAGEAPCHRRSCLCSLNSFHDFDSFRETAYYSISVHGRIRPVLVLGMTPFCYASCQRVPSLFPRAMAWSILTFLSIRSASLTHQNSSMYHQNVYIIYPPCSLYPSSHAKYPGITSLCALLSGRLFAIYVLNEALEGQSFTCNITHDKIYQSPDGGTAVTAQAGM